MYSLLPCNIYFYVSNSTVDSTISLYFKIINSLKNVQKWKCIYIAMFELMVNHNNKYV